MLTHAIIIRFHYEKNDPRFEWRLAYFKSMVLPRILAQTSQNFVIAIRCNPCHQKIFNKLSNKIITFTVKNEGAKYKQGPSKKFFYDFCPWSDVNGLEKFDIQTGLDSDDLIAEDYLEKIEKEVFRFRLTNPGKSLHITFQPELFNTKTLEKYSIGQVYNPQMGSAFFSIYQPDKTNYFFAYEESHLTLCRRVNQSIVLPIGSCWASVHEYNESTGK